MKTDILNGLKEKIFSVLLGEIKINEFEGWLYNEENIINSIEEDTFIYDLVTINYKEENAIAFLREIAFQKFQYEEYMILIIGMNCEKLLKLNEWHSIHKVFNEIFSFFDYDDDYSLMWSFYSINENIGLIDIGWETKANVIDEIKKLSLHISNQLKECNTSSERINLLLKEFEDKTPVKTMVKTTIKERVFIKEVHNKWYEFWK